MTMEEFLGQLAEILDVPTGSLRTEDKLENLEGWNSMAMVAFIALADEHFGRILSPRQFASCVSVGDLAKLAGLNG